MFADTLDPGAEGLIRALCRSPLAENSRIRIMPDVHAGKGCVIGTTMYIGDKAAPGLVGTDIGCGISAFEVRGKRNVEFQKLDTLIRDTIPVGFGIRSVPHEKSGELSLDSLHCFRHIQKEKVLCSLGTLGGGNHFIELDRGEDGAYWLLIHSGSRRLGAEIAEYYQKQAFQQSPEGTPYELAYLTGEEKSRYLHDMEIAMGFAEWNRRVIAQEIIKGMKWKVISQFDTVHNYIDAEAGILRKGAVSAKEGERLLIPMNMRDGCFLCEGKGNPEWNQSAPHGAGRCMNREESRHSFTVSQYKKEMKAVFSSTVGEETLDESPMAYKPMEEIREKLGETVTIRERIVPVFNFKGMEKGGKKK